MENDKHWPGCRKTGTLLNCLWECKMMQMLWKIIWQFLKKLNIVSPYGDSTPSIVPKELKIGMQIHNCTFMFTAVFFEFAKR
jgi:hypothetical protein